MQLHTCMLFHWDANIIKSAIATLTAREQVAISTVLSDRRRRTVGLATAKRLGFESVDDFQAAMATGINHLKAYLAVIGIRSINDLDFQEPVISIEGTIAARNPAKVKKVDCAAMNRQACLIGGISSSRSERVFSGD